MKRTTEIRHHKQDMVRTALMCGHVALVGPAGVGKTTMARRIAEDLKLDFYFTGAVMSEHKLVGFIDARGQVVRTPFRDAFEKGGVFLFDEVDASAPAALLAMNAALSNGQMDFPDACIKAHPDFKVIAASNTFWTGADRVYVGRNQLDGATLDRFIMIGVDYDEDMERKIAGDDEWVTFVQSVRRAVRELEVRHVVSPRASIAGALLLKQGMPLDEVKAIALWKGIDPAQRDKILAYLEPKKPESRTSPDPLRMADEELMERMAALSRQLREQGMLTPELDKAMKALEREGQRDYVRFRSMDPFRGDFPRFPDPQSPFKKKGR